MTHSFPTRRSSDLSPERKQRRCTIPGIEPMTKDTKAASHNPKNPCRRREDARKQSRAAHSSDTAQLISTDECYLVIFFKENGVLTLNERSEEHTSELQSLMSISYAVFCLKK